MTNTITKFFTATLAAMLVTATVRAQDLSPQAAAQAAIAVENEQDPILCSPKVRTAPTAVGVSISALGILGGLGIMGAGAVDLDGQRTKGQKAMMAGGAAFIAASVAGLITSAIYLHRAKEKRYLQWRYCPETRRHRQQ